MIETARLTESDSWAQYVAFIVATLAAVLFIGIRVVLPINGLRDEDAYWLAAMRLREGGLLYPPTDGGDVTAYRYAPWFALAWVPLTYLPQPVAYLLWEGLLLACAVYVVWRIASLGGPAAAVLAGMALPLIGAVEAGNVETVLVALLVWRQADPWSVGLAGSLKVYPLLMCAGYVAERRWRELVITVGLAGLLWLPAIWFGLEHYVTAPSHTSASLWSAAPLLVPLVVGGLAWFTLRGSRWTWLAAGAAIPLLVPHYASLSYVLVAAVRLASRSTRRTRLTAPVAPRRMRRARQPG